jgi:hypothetical protein
VRDAALKMDEVNPIEPNFDTVQINRKEFRKDSMREVQERLLFKC